MRSPAKLQLNGPTPANFPSYEMIVAPPVKGKWFEPYMRTVKPQGVEAVVFFKKFSEPVNAPAPTRKLRDSEAVVCDEEILSADQGVPSR